MSNSISNNSSISALSAEVLSAAPEMMDTMPVLPASNEVPNLRELLRNVTVQYAQGVANRLPAEQLQELKDESERLTESIRFIDQSIQVFETQPEPRQTAEQSNYSKEKFFVPKDLPTWQWKGNMWDHTSEEFESVEDLLDTFELMVSSNGLDMNSQWSRLIPRKMNRDQRSWFIATLANRGYTWATAKNIIISNYATQDTAQLICSIDQLLTMKMRSSESVEAFTDRFQRVRRSARWEDDFKAAAIYKRALYPSLYTEVARFLYNVPLHQQDSVGRIAAAARNVMSSNIFQVENHDTLPRKKNGATQDSFSSSSALTFVGKQANNGIPARHAQSKYAHSAPVLSARGSTATFKVKQYCKMHGKGNHTTDKCIGYKKLAEDFAATNATPPVAAPSVYSTKKSKVCFKCTDNVPWTPAHAATCRKDKYMPTHAIRSARLVIPDNHEAAFEALTLDTQESSQQSMELDQNSIPAITIEHIDTFALVDTGELITMFLAP